MLRPFVLAAVLAGSVQLGVPAANACPPRDLNLPCDRNDSQGVICNFASIEDPNAEPGTQSGQISGGPLLVYGVTGTLTCRIQVNQPTGGGSGPSVSGAGTSLFVIAPEVVDYQADDDDNVYLCSEFTDADGTWYWNQATQTWSQDINTPCSLAFGSNEPTDEEKLIDSIICPVLAIVFPPEGDIPGIWDCPPYGNV